VMVPIFVRVNEIERERKIYGTTNDELHNVTDAEFAWLRGENPKQKNIDQVVKQLAGK
jgi:hypothetical protein